MEPNEPVTDKATEAPEEDQGVQLGDATPLESEPESPESSESSEGTEEQPKIDESVLSIEQRNIMNSPNIAAPTTGPSEEEIAEQKRQEELAKLDELKPLVAETLIDNGSSMERKKRRPLVVALIIVAVVVLVGMAGVFIFSNQKQPTKDIKTPVIHYTEEVKVGVDSRIKAAFEEVAGTINNFEKVTSATPKNNAFPTRLLSNGTYDLFITRNYEENIVDPGEDPTYVDITVTPFLNDAIVVIVNKDLPLESITSAEASQLFTGDLDTWNSFAGISYGEEQTETQAVSRYHIQDKYLKIDTQFIVTGGDNPYGSGEDVDDTAMAVNKIAEDANGVAFVRRSDLTTDMLNTVKMLSIDTVTPSNDTIADASYPYTIRYYIVNLSSLANDSVPIAYRDALLEKANNSSTMRKSIQLSFDCHQTDDANGEVTTDCAILDK